MYNALTIFAISLITVVISVDGYADPLSAGDTVIVDGISVLSGSRTANESDAIPLLLSDIEFESVLILASRLGPAAINHRPDTEDWLRARRRATMIRLLAGHARHLHEIADPDVKRQIKTLIVKDLGGEVALDRLLTRLGMKRSALDNWLENATLALGQINFLKEQVELPSRRDIGARILSDGGDPADTPSVREKYRRLLREEKTAEQLERWLQEIGQQGHIRIIR